MQEIDVKIMLCLKYNRDSVSYVSSTAASELPPAKEQAASNECLHIHQNFLFVFRYT